MVTRTLAELAEALKGQIVGDGSVLIRDVAGIREALPGDVTFIANSRYDAYLDETRASAVICARDTRMAQVPLLLVENPYLAFQQVVRIFRPDRDRPPAGVHPTAVVATDAVLGAEVSVGPWCVVESGAQVGDRVVIHSHGYVGPRAEIGEDTLLYPRVTIREECVIGRRCILHPGVVVGSDGFGFAFDEGRYHKIPQVGNVVIGDDVEIGANTTIDRATTHSTRVGEGTKIDNLVQIGHNVVIGKHCIIVAQVGISGSTELEDHVTLGGQAGLVGHIRVGEGAMVGAQSGVTKSVDTRAIMSGTPAIPHGLWKRIQALLQRLPQLVVRVRDVEERIEKLEHRDAEQKTEERVR
jgi:UDP-3-O-[3-hydroxymyristoyl] glucosamine N-acyltransferase